MIRRLVLLSFALSMAFGALVACNSNESVVLPSTALFVGTDGTQRITAQGLHELWAKGQVFVIDTRGDAAFQTGHIKGAVVIPVEQILSRLNELPPDKMIVAYCT